jgi:hypothetical protein
MTIVCLILASKYDELDDKIPFIKNVSDELHEVVKFTQKEFINLETKILF